MEQGWLWETGWWWERGEGREEGCQAARERQGRPSRAMGRSSSGDQLHINVEGRKQSTGKGRKHNVRPQNSMKDQALGQAERRMKAALKPQRTQRINTNQEAGCWAGTAASAMQLHLYQGAEGGGGPPFGRKHISISQITASVALVLCSLRLLLAFPAKAGLSLHW